MGSASLQRHDPTRQSQAGPALVGLLFFSGGLEQGRFLANAVPPGRPPRLALRGSDTMVPLEPAKVGLACVVAPPISHARSSNAAVRDPILVLSPRVRDPLRARRRREMRCPRLAEENEGHEWTAG